MNVLPLRGDWTPDEHCEIARIRDICGRCDRLKLECSHTDEGDPWCVVYDETYGRIVLHIARIDRRYVVVSPMQNKSTRAISMVEAAEIALRDLEALVD